MSKKVICTGVTGMDGSLMVDHLLATTNHEIYGVVRRLSVPNHKNISHIKSDRFHLVEADVTDQCSIERIIRNIRPDYFINFAANSFVGNSWGMPMNHIGTNFLGPVYQLEALREYAPDCRYYNAGCHHPDAKVVTPNGLKKYSELKEGDLVFTLNEKTREIELKPIKKVLEFDYNGDLLHFTGRGKDQMLTPNHRVLIQSKRGNLFYKEASEAAVTSSFQYPRGEWTGETLSSMTVLSDGSSIPTDTLMYLIGLYLGDGSCDYTKGSYRNFFFVPETDKSWDTIKFHLDQSGFEWRRHGNVAIYINSRGLYDAFDQLGHTSYEKGLTNEIKSFNKKHLQLILDGLRAADGDKRGVIHTVSSKLKDDVVEISIKCGHHVSVRERSPRTAFLKDGRVIKGTVNAYEIITYKGNIGYTNGQNLGKGVTKKAQNTPYNGKVWCLEMEDNHNFLVERNGKYVFSGNSSEEWGNVDYSPQDEKHPMKPRSPYGVSKCASRLMCKVYRESYNMYAIQGHLLNHEGIRRGHEFVTRKISLAVARIKKALDQGKDFEPLELGNLDAKRDWSDAEDFVRGVWMMLNQEFYRKDFPVGACADINLTKKWFIGNLKEYVLSSNETHSIREFVEKAFAAAGIKGVWWNPSGKPEDEQYLLSSDGILATKKYVPLLKINKEFYRPCEVELLHGDSTLARNELGWSPEYTFDDLVERMVKNDIKELS